MGKAIGHGKTATCVQHLKKYPLARFDPYLWCDTDCRARRSCWGSWGNSVRWETGRGRRKGRRRRRSRAAEGTSPGRWHSGASEARCAGRCSWTLPASCVEGWTRCGVGPEPVAALRGDERKRGSAQRRRARCCYKRSYYCKLTKAIHCCDYKPQQWASFFFFFTQQIQTLFSNYVYLESPHVCSGTGWHRCPSAWSRRGTRSTPGLSARGGTAGQASATPCSRWHGEDPSCGTLAVSRPANEESSHTCLKDSNQTVRVLIRLVLCCLKP